MTSQEAITEFAKQHGLDVGTLPTEERDAIQFSVRCSHAIDVGYRSLPTSVLESDPAVGLIWQLYQRCTERAFGALAAFTTSCVASSEILARATIEATLTVRFILGDAPPRLASFFRDHLDQAERLAQQWGRAIENLPATDRSLQQAAIAYRVRGIGAMKQHVDTLTGQLVLTGNVRPWPNIAARFEAVGESLDYRTFYARLCAESHFDAEETLRFFLGTVIGGGMLESLAVETVMFSRFLLAEAIRTYALAGAEFAGCYGMHSARAECLSAERTMRRHVTALSNGIGAAPAGKEQRTRH